MPYSKCTSCRTRLYSALAPADSIGALCPTCGALLEPVHALTEIVGYKAITIRDGELEEPVAAAAVLRARRP